MFKKAGYIILTSLLLIVTVGFVVSRHYCDDMLVSVALDAPADHCDHSMNDNCCHDESEYMVLKTDYTQPVTEELTVAETDVLLNEINPLFAEFAPENTADDLHLVFVPPHGKNMALSLNRSFLL